MSPRTGSGYATSERRPFMSTETGPAVDAEPRGHVPVPGPKGLPFLGNLPQFGKNPLAFFERLRGYGDMVSWRFGPNSCVFIADPECIGELLTETERTFDQPALGIAFRTVMGNGVVVARGPDWRRKRSLVQPSVRPKQVRSYAATMAGSTVELADTWSGGERIDIKREMAALTQRIAVRTIFGVDTPADAEAMGRAMDVAQQEIGKEFSGIGALLPDWVPTPGRSRIKKAAAVIDAEVGRVVARHRDGDGERPDLLKPAADRGGRERRAAHRRGDPRRDRHPLHRRARDHQLHPGLGVVPAVPQPAGARRAHRGAGPGARRPGAGVRRLRATDVHPGCGQGDAAAVPDDLAGDRGRQGGARIGGVDMPKGTRVWTSQWATHRDERWFPEPEEFRPERWDAESGDDMAEYAWFPFGGGPRVCLGTRFAMVEAVLILAVLARRFELEVDAGDVNPVPTLTLQPDRDVMATVRAR